MAYQKLQVTKALEVIPSDNSSIPNTALVAATGTSTSVIVLNGLEDTAASFTSTVRVGDIVWNTRDNAAATVTSVVSDTELGLNADIFGTSPVGASYAIYRGQPGACVLYVGVGGNVKVTTSGGDTVTFYNLNNGQFVPVQVTKVFYTGTTATNLIALW